MTPDHLALAKDVDRLFRARQDGRQMPAGRSDLTTPGYTWIPAVEEWRARISYVDMEGVRHGYDRDCPELLVVGDKAYLRTRRHVAMLALTEPEHFRRCLYELSAWERDVDEAFMDAVARSDDPTDETRPSRDEVCARFNLSTRRFEYEQAVIAHRGGHPFVLTRPVSSTADLGRTGAYLADLQERLRIWRERDEVGRMNAAREREAIEEAEIDRRTEAAIEVDGDTLAAMKV